MRKGKQGRGGGREGDRRGKEKRKCKILRRSETGRQGFTYHALYLSVFELEAEFEEDCGDGGDDD